MVGMDLKRMKLTTNAESATHLAFSAMDRIIITVLAAFQLVHNQYINQTHLRVRVVVQPPTIS